MARKRDIRKLLRNGVRGYRYRPPDPTQDTPQATDEPASNPPQRAHAPKETDHG